MAADTLSPGSRRDRLVLVVLIGALGLFYAVFARVALHAFPFSGDEYSTVLQGELFARGQMRAPAPPHPELLRVDHVLMDETVRSKYPPGASALLAVGVRLGAPWMVTPIEAVLALVAVALATRRSLGEREATLAVALVGVAPLFAWQAATFYSHTATTMWLAFAFAALASWRGEPRAWKLVVGGVAVGSALLTRPLDAALFLAALLSLRSISVLAWTGLGVAPFAGLLLAYQAAQFGSPFADGYHAYEPTFRAIYGAQTGAHAVSLSYVYRGDHLWNHLDILRALVVDWTVPGTVLLALLGWFALRRREADGTSPALAGPDRHLGGAGTATMRRFSVTLVGLFGASLFVTVGGFDDGARPRYLSTALIPLGWLAAAGWRDAADALEKYIGPSALRVVGAAVWVLPIIQLSAVLVERTPALWLREGLEKAVEREGIREGVVIVRATYPTRYARNGPFFDRPLLYVSAPPQATADEVASAFPARPIYEAHEGERWLVVRVR